MISTLDPNPKNQLGKGVFSPEDEAKMLAQGYVFACRFPPTKDKPFWSRLVCKRPVADAVTDMELDNPYAISYSTVA